jgi:hypothetical protein
MRRSALKTIFALLMVLLLFGVAQAFFLTSICTVTGTIYMYGHVAEKGLLVEAYIGEEKIAETETAEAGRFNLKLHEYDPANPDQGGFRSPDDVVQIKLSGKDAKPTIKPNRDKLTVTLNVEQTLDVKLSTWGKIKALFK